MTIDEAIKVLSEYVFEDKPQDITAFDNATRLGIEALKRRKRESERTSRWADISLPGETEG